MNFKRTIISLAILLSIFGSVYFSDANTAQTDFNNLQRAVIEMKKLIDANNAKITELEKRVHLLEKNENKNHMK